jgi:Tfp pilus assembly protein PilV
MKRGSQGFSLVQTMVAAGIAGAILLALSQMMVSSQKTARGVGRVRGTDALRTSLTEILSPFGG